MSLTQSSLKSCSYVMSPPLAILICLLLGTPRLYCTAAEPQATVPELIQTAAQLKTGAEEWAAVLKESYQRKKVSEANYLRARSLYIDARTAVEGWLTRLQAELETGQNIQPSREYDQLVQVAAANADSFISYAKGIVLDRPRSGPTIVGDLLKVFVDAGVQIWKEWRSAGQQQKKALVDRIQSLKWLPFDEIKTSVK